MPEFVKVAKTAEIQPGNCIGVKVEGVFVGIYNINGQYHAINNICPHLGGVLHYGFLSEQVITCPIHLWEFDVTTGKCVWPGQERIATYPVKVEDEDVLVDVNSPKFADS
ncbi:Rieske (2Fe-2S) protein [Candidatus Poribacteria bacterium]|nr:Rieske (2Fe-2S) protein [Candidatus Poribacteria bacterium]